jgi:flagellar protein FliO/FliZ
LTVVGELAVGPKERVVLVRVGDAQALVGVGSGGLTSLSLLDKPVQVGQTAAETATFAQRLREIMNRAGGGK